MLSYLCKGAAMVGFSHHYCDDKKQVDSMLKNKFHEHMADEGLSYGTKEEYLFRFELFKQTEDWIQQVNAEQTSFVLEHNMFSTMTEGEIDKMRGLEFPKTEQMDYQVLDDQNLEPHVDWRDHGAVNQIKRQGRCGSCWAFSSNAVIESAQKIKHGKLLSFSEQQLVACSDPNSFGCKGGSFERAFNYAHVHGMAVEEDYPYISSHGKPIDCDKSKESKGHVKVNRYYRVTPNSVDQLKAAISKNVVAVAVDADRTFRQYKSGILNSEKCGSNLNHGVAIVGYGTENGQDYYIVRNSWGGRWAQKGYGKIAAIDGTKGICGIQQYMLWADTV